MWIIKSLLLQYQSLLKGDSSKLKRSSSSRGDNVTLLVFFSDPVETSLDIILLFGLSSVLPVPVSTVFGPLRSSTLLLRLTFEMPQDSLSIKYFLSLVIPLWKSFRYTLFYWRCTNKSTKSWSLPNLSRIIHVAFSFSAASTAADFGEDACATCLWNTIWHWNKENMLQTSYSRSYHECELRINCFLHLTLFASQSSLIREISALSWFSFSFPSTSSWVAFCFACSLWFAATLLLHPTEGEAQSGNKSVEKIV